MCRSAVVSWRWATHGTHTSIGNAESSALNRPSVADQVLLDVIDTVTAMHAEAKLFHAPTPAPSLDCPAALDATDDIFAPVPAEALREIAEFLFADLNRLGAFTKSHLLLPP